LREKDVIGSRPGFPPFMVHKARRTRKISKKKANSLSFCLVLSENSENITTRGLQGADVLTRHKQRNVTKTNSPTVGFSVGSQGSDQLKIPLSHIRSFWGFTRAGLEGEGVAEFAGELVDVSGRGVGERHDIGGGGGAKSRTGGRPRGSCRRGCACGGSIPSRDIRGVGEEGVMPRRSKTQVIAQPCHLSSEDNYSVTVWPPVFI